MTTDRNVPFTRFTTWESIRNGDPDVFQLIKAFWIAYLVSKDKKFLHILQSIVDESPEIIKDRLIHRVLGKPRKELDILLELEKNPTGLALWVYILERIHHLDDLGLHVLRTSEVIPEIEQNKIFLNTPMTPNRRLVRHRIISSSPYDTAQWYRIHFEGDKLIASRLSEQTNEITLPPIRQSDETTYLVIKPNTGLIWYPIAKSTAPATYG